MKDTFVNLDNARFDDQRKVMEEIKAVGECPFCADGMTKYHKNPIIKETSHWLAKQNDYPYDGTKVHLLLISKDHTEKLADLTPEMGADLVLMLQWAEEYFAIESGAFALRFGDIRYNGASVKHLHVHLVVGDVHDPNHEKIKFKMSVPAKDLSS